MINKLKPWLWKIISSGLPPGYDLEVLRKIFLLNLLFIFGSFSLIGLSIIAFIQKDSLLGIVDLSIFLFLACLFFYLRKTKRVILVSKIGTVAIGIFYFFLVTHGGINKT
ncbi:MAG: hypothetical protein JRF25_08440, partial [Deltaproteobacteria bacterium]|nr:hypothetical protein [Deltaproteobacteria bacterium]